MAILLAPNGWAAGHAVSRCVLAACTLLATWHGKGAMAQVLWEPVPEGPVGGWLEVDEGWEEPVDVVPWGSGGFAIGLNVYGELGVPEPRLVRADVAGIKGTCVLAPEGTIGGMAAGEAGGVWVVWNAGTLSTTAPEGSAQTAVLGYFPSELTNTTGIPAPSAGPVLCPWATPWSEAEAVVATEDGGALVVGWGLDPCCAHRELPFFWKVRADGSPDPGFGWGGVSVVDVAEATTIRPPGNTYHETLDSPAQRHDIGGFFSSITPFQGGWVAGGGYSNGSAYELMLVRIDATGQLDSAFGDEGIVRLNAFPGMSHFVDDVISEAGQLVSLVAVPPNAETESRCVAWVVQASGESVGWEEAPLPGFRADRWERAQGMLWATGLSPEGNRHVPSGMLWRGGFAAHTRWSLSHSRSAARMRSAWHPDLAMLATVVQLSGALPTESDWGLRAWSPWVSDMLHK